MKNITVGAERFAKLMKKWKSVVNGKLVKFVDAAIPDYLSNFNFAQLTSSLKTKAIAHLEQLKLDVALDLFKNKNIVPELADEVTALGRYGDNCNAVCAVNKFGCFAGETKVKTSKGLIAINKIQNNDSVWSYNHQLKMYQKKLVTSTKRTVATLLCVLALNNGSQVLATPNHPIYIDGDYVEAGNIPKGSTLKTYDGQKLWVQNTHLVDTILDVYNLTVADNSNYLIGEAGVLVHNDCFLAKLGSYKKLIAKLDDLTPVQKAKFIDDFAGRNNFV